MGVLAPATAAGAHTLYYGPARAAALRVAANTQAAVTADPDIPAVGTGHGVRGCHRMDRHSWRCEVWVSARGLGGQSVRCGEDVIVRYAGLTSRVIRVFALGRPKCV
ncbi:MAG: hypothetical protein ACJ76S_02220 [Solirubrobacteraceae bacterium]